mmetsp:Transcript_21424/g.30670  ORF Transcript_21424/g.30670 Transcript_21424/m.30670 type:complete len:576 (-) Transcript_21424:575-2302(-)
MFLSSDKPYDEEGLASSGQCNKHDGEDTIALSGLEYSCISELGKGFKGMIEEMSKDPREIERIRSARKTGRQRSTAGSAASRNTQSSYSTSSCTSASTISTIFSHKNSVPVSYRNGVPNHSTVFLPFIEEYGDKQEDQEEEEGLEVLLAPRTTVNTTQEPTFQLMDEPSPDDKKYLNSTVKGKADLKLWASKLLAQKRLARNIRDETTSRHYTVPLANKLSDVSEDTPHNVRQAPTKLSVNRLAAGRSVPVGTRVTLLREMDESRYRSASSTYPDDERHQNSCKDFDMPHAFDQLTNAKEKSSMIMARRMEPLFHEEETPIRKNTTVINTRKGNQSGSRYSSSSSDAKILNCEYNEVYRHPKEMNLMNLQNLPHTHSLFKPAALSREHIASRQVILEQKVLMTPPPAKSRVANQRSLLSQMNVVTPDLQSFSTDNHMAKHSSEGEKHFSTTQNPRRRLQNAGMFNDGIDAASFNSSLMEPFQNKSDEAFGHTRNLQNYSVPSSTVAVHNKEAIVEEWLADKCSFIHPHDIRLYAKQLTDMGFDSKLMLEHELRADDLNFMKLAHKRVFLSSLGFN